LNDLPIKNTASRTKGFWFVFNDGENTIVAEASSSKGEEYVYVNGKLLSEKSTALTVSEHEFKHGEQEYKIIFNVKNLPMGSMECSFFIDGKRTKTYKVFLKFRIAKVILCVIMGGAGGIIGNYFRWPLWIVTPLTPLLVFLFLVLFKSSHDYAFKEVGA
jgi:hypothetical protein